MDIKCGYKSINGDYIFQKVANEVAKYKKGGIKIPLLDLSVGDVKFPPPKKVGRAIVKQSIYFNKSAYFCGYPPECGIYELKKRISEYYASLGADVDSDEIFITTGAKPALGELFEICNFSRAQIIIPTYPLYEELCRLHGVKVEFVKSQPKNAFPLPKNGGDVLFACSPNNPTGEVLTEGQTKDLARYCNEKGMLLVIDGAYADFTDRYYCPYLVENCDNVVEVRSYSKNLSFTGIRCGYVVIKKQNPIHSAYKKYLSLRSNGVNVITQRAVISSYCKKSKMQERKRIEYYRTNAEILRSAFVNSSFSVIGGENAPYLLIGNLKQNGEDFFKKLLYSLGIAVTPGEAFFAPNSVRISCLCSSNTAKRASRRLKDFVSKV